MLLCRDYVGIALKFRTRVARTCVLLLFRRSSRIDLRPEDSGPTINYRSVRDIVCLKISIQIALASAAGSLRACIETMTYIILMYVS